jgi:hypothetical protein
MSLSLARWRSRANAGHFFELRDYFASADARRSSHSLSLCKDRRTAAHVTRAMCEHAWRTVLIGANGLERQFLWLNDRRSSNGLECQFLWLNDQLS